MNDPSPTRVFVCIVSYAIGVVVMICSDIQKTITLQYKKGLISNGFNTIIRNPNYLGEMLIYSSFAIATGNIISYCIVGFVFIVLF